MKQRLLIVSSSADEVKGLSAAFSNLETITLLPPATDCPQALAALSGDEPADILLLDLILRNGDGISVLDAAAALPAAVRPAAFVMTALTDARLLYAIQDKIVFCFAKPLVYERVALRVLQLMQAPDAPRPVPSQDCALDTAISASIREIGIPAHLSGYYYLRDAIRIYATSDMPLKLRITSDVYPMIASAYGTTSLVVENAMRTAIEHAWTHGNLAAIHRFFGYTVNEKYGRPGNAEFVMLMAEHVRQTPARGCR